MRKTITGARLDQPDSESSQGWLNLEQLAAVEVTSEDPRFPIESVFSVSSEPGWQASQKGEQQIRIVFDEPQSLHRIQLRFDESKFERMQEFTLRLISAAGTAREIVRQQWNFSPTGSTTEVEDIAINGEAVSAIELTIQPDVGRGEAMATLTSFRLRYNAMPSAKMHANEVAIDVTLVRRLLAAQFPEWRDLELKQLASAGTDNAMFRLGDNMVVRLPRIPASASQVQKEQRWLPYLAPHLPLRIPVPLTMGTPADGYPWHWSIYEWLPGETMGIEGLADPQQAAVALADFIADLKRVDARHGPLPGPQNFGRGVPLSDRDEMTRTAIASVGDMFDTGELIDAWETALQATPWSGPPLWIHGDLQSGNLLTQQGQLSAVIDFGCLGIGDPACDLQVAWNFFSEDSRQVFREALQVDDDAWKRGRGWALSVGLVALPYYRTTNPVLAKISGYAIEQVLADCSGASPKRNICSQR